MLKTKRLFTCMVGLFICWMIAPFYLEGPSEAAPLPVPVQVSPASGTEFHNYPRTFTMTWKKVKDATYEVEIDCLHCKQVGKWDSEVGPPHKLTGITETSASFTFWGDNQGRWRVKAVSGKKNYNDSNWSPWWNFSFKTAPTAKPDLIVPSVKFEKVKSEVDAKKQTYWIFNVIITVKNQGGSAAGPFKVLLERNVGPGGAYTKACETCEIDVAGLAAGESKTLSPRQFNNANNMNSIFRATADSKNSVVESNETNNMNAETFTP